MRPPGAFKIAHRPRSFRNFSLEQDTNDRAHSGTEVGSSAEVSGDLPHPAPDLESCLGPFLASDARSQRVVESLRAEIVEAGAGQDIRIRRVFQEPRQIFRLELALPSLGYHRTTLLDREALEMLLEIDEVRAIVQTGELDL